EPSTTARKRRRQVVDVRQRRCADVGGADVALGEVAIRSAVKRHLRTQTARGIGGCAAPSSALRRSKAEWTQCIPAHSQDAGAPARSKPARLPPTEAGR